MSELDLSNLNESQLEAVKTTEGPVMVMAGAGSGKTKVLTTRIAYLISELGVGINNILAVTFTNKAAREMKERVENNLQISTRYMWISTFHSFCARFLRLEMDKLAPFTKRFVIVDEDDSIAILRDIIKSLGLDIKEINPKAYKKRISNYKNGTNIKFSNDSEKTMFNTILSNYNNHLKEENLVDFDDLICHTITILSQDKDLLRKYQSKFSYIMVDEFQDTNTLQYKLMWMLAINHHNIFVVGDQDQSIYSFRGAKIENIDLFKKDFLETKVILLERNYRSTPEILNAANSVIKHNTNRFKKTLVSSLAGGKKPVFYNASSQFDENMFVVDQIKSLVKQGYNYRDFAIMYRSNFISRTFEDVLVKQHIPYQMYGGISFFSRKEIKDVVAYLRLILNNDDDFSFKRIVNEPKRKIGQALMQKLSDSAIENNCSLFEAIDYVDASGPGYNNILAFKFMILELQEKLEQTPLIDFIDVLIVNTDYKHMLDEQGDAGQDRLANIEEFKSSLKEADEYYEGNNYEKLEQVLSDLALRTDTDNKDDNSNSVKIMTFHQAKGLEFPVIFMVALEEGIFPSKNSFTPKEIEEERRICYVGITRAKEKLFLSCARSRYLFGYVHNSIPSTFISEIGEDLLDNHDKPKFSAPKRSNTKYSIRKDSAKSKSEAKASLFALGDKLNHKLFGDGIIVNVSGNIITVAFKAPYGIKKLQANHPSIRKI